MTEIIQLVMLKSNLLPVAIQNLFPEEMPVKMNSALSMSPLIKSHVDSFTWVPDTSAESLVSSGFLSHS